MKSKNCFELMVPRWAYPLALVAALGAPVNSRAGIEIVETEDPETGEIQESHVGVHERGDGPRLIGGATVRAARTVSMRYHGGPIMLGTINLYVIWYGNWAGNSALTLIPGFLGTLSDSPYWNINKTYYDSQNLKISGFLAYGGATSVSYPYGTSLTDAQIQQVVADAIGGNKFPKDPNGIYFVLTSADVTASSGFCTQYCGWHTHATIGGSDIKYSFVGNPDRCITSCAAQSTSPNGNPGADGMISIIAHEAEEAATDPDLNAWYDTRGAENADKCAWTFGTLLTASNGSKYNMTLGGINYLVQQNWVNTGSGFCSMK